MRILYENGWRLELTDREYPKSLQWQTIKNGFQVWSNGNVFTAILMRAADCVVVMMMDGEKPKIEHKKFSTQNPIKAAEFAQVYLNQWIKSCL